MAYLHLKFHQHFWDKIRLLLEMIQESILIQETTLLHQIYRMENAMEEGRMENVRIYRIFIL